MIMEIQNQITPEDIKLTLTPEEIDLDSASDVSRVFVIMNKIENFLKTYLE